MKIEITHQVKERKLTEFWFKLSETITQLRVNITANNEHDEIISELETIYLCDKWYLLAGYENVKVKNWKFTIEGIKVSDNKKFRKTIKYSLN